MDDADTRLQELAVASALTEWQRALAWEERLYAWHQANPSAPYWEAEEWAKGQGIPGLGERGRMRYLSTRSGDSWQALPLRHRTPMGRWMIQCLQCGVAALLNSPMTGSGHCPTCRAEQLQQRAAVKAERRVERRRERSAALASRQGRCLVCHSPMTVARVTRTTCSDRCRKQWIRKGAEAFPLPETPAAVKIGDQEMPLAEAHSKIASAKSNHALELVYAGRGKELDTDSKLQQLRAALAQVERLMELQRLREEAPAIFLAELMESEGAT